MKIFVIATLVAELSACAYQTSFQDCEVRCAADNACPNGLTCGGEGLCREAAAIAPCAIAIVDAGLDVTPTDATPPLPPSCVGLASTCGPTGTSPCCAISLVPGGTFDRSYDVGSDGMFPSTSYPATVSSFRLDAYEVTVGRFRAFVSAGQGTQVNPPTIDAGARTLNGSADQGGWDPSWDPSLAATTTALVAALKCDATYQTWTDAPGANETLPMNCLTWYEAIAFCAWDGGFLPTEAEWNYAAAGGSEQRAYPWSSPPSSLTVDCAHANYDPGDNPGSFCVNSPNGGLNRVGSESPTGDGKWGHADLAGDVWNWELDWYAAQYPTTSCDDCANFDPGGTCPTACPTRVVRGGSFNRAAPDLRTSNRGFSVPGGRSDEFGVRCARSP